MPIEKDKLKISNTYWNAIINKKENKDVREKEAISYFIKEKDIKWNELLIVTEKDLQKVQDEDKESEFRKLNEDSGCGFLNKINAKSKSSRLEEFLVKVKEERNSRFGKFDFESMKELERWFQDKEIKLHSLRKAQLPQISLLREISVESGIERDLVSSGF